MSLARYAWLGILGGLVGAVLMAMVEMTNELLSGHSFFLPPHMIAAPFFGKAPMEHAMNGGPLYLEGAPFVAGLVIHMMWTAGWGLVFGVIAGITRLVGTAALCWSIVYGVVAGFVMSYLVLPLVGLDPIPQSSGWVPFFLMHIAYGIGPGAVIAYATRRAAVGAAGMRRAA
jgi:hypothetical protein